MEPTRRWRMTARAAHLQRWADEMERVGGGRTVEVPEGGDMIKVSALYPNTAGSKFDMPYYLDKHIPMVRQKLGSAFRGVSVEEGLGGGQPESPPAYLAMGHLLFDSIEAFQASFGLHAQAILGDIPNFTNTQPTIQISEVKL
jgi:uncharacterized protein (TIGR02118 family)